MGLFSKRTDINDGVRAFEQTEGAVLLDVRSRREYAAGHIPHSMNLPLQEIDDVMQKVSSMETPLYVYCMSGARSTQAEMRLRELGYVNVHNIGGIGYYTGELEE